MNISLMTKHLLKELRVKFPAYDDEDLLMLAVSNLYKSTLESK